MSDEGKEYCESIKAGWILMKADLDRKMNILDEIVREMLNKNDFDAPDLVQFVEDFKKRVKRPTKEGEVSIVIDGIDFLTMAIGYAFVRGFDYFCKKTEMYLNDEILKKMEAIWGKKNTPYKTWDASKINEN